MWDWNPAVDERATGSNPPWCCPTPASSPRPPASRWRRRRTPPLPFSPYHGRRSAPRISPATRSSSSPPPSRPGRATAAPSVPTAAAIPTAEPTGFRLRAVARSGAVSGWRQALVPAAVAAPTATGIAGGIRLSGGFPADAVRLQVFEATSSSLAAATKLAEEPTGLILGPYRPQRRRHPLVLAARGSRPRATSRPWPGR